MNGKKYRFFKAVRNNWKEEIIYYLNHGIYIDGLNRYGYNALHIAIEEEDIDLIDFLLEKGANINFNKQGYYTPIEWACLLGNEQIVKHLLRKGSDIKYYSLHYATYNGNTQIVEMLINKGIDVNYIDNYNKTALCWAAQENKMDIAQLLIEKNADVNYMTDDGFTPLYIAAAGGYYNLVKLFIKKGAKVDLGNMTTPFMIACAYEYYDVADLLLKNGADINAIDEDGRNELFMAKVIQNEQLITFLTERGADCNIIDKFGYSIERLDNDEKLREKIYKELF